MVSKPNILDRPVGGNANANSSAAAPANANRGVGGGGNGTAAAPAPEVDVRKLTVRTFAKFLDFKKKYWIHLIFCPSSRWLSWKKSTIR